MYARARESGPASPAGWNVATSAGITLTVTGVDTYGNEVSGQTYTSPTTTGTVDAAPGGKTKTISVTVTESSLPLGRQATSATLDPEDQIAYPFSPVVCIRATCPS